MTGLRGIIQGLTITALVALAGVWGAGLEASECCSQPHDQRVEVQPCCDHESHHQECTGQPCTCLDQASGQGQLMAALSSAPSRLRPPTSLGEPTSLPAPLLEGRASARLAQGREHDLWGLHSDETFLLACALLM